MCLLGNQSPLLMPILCLCYREGENTGTNLYFRNHSSACLMQSQAWWCMSVIPVLEKLKWEDCKLKTNLSKKTEIDKIIHMLNSSINFPLLYMTYIEFLINWISNILCCLLINVVHIYKEMWWECPEITGILHASCLSLKQFLHIVSYNSLLYLLWCNPIISFIWHSQLILTQLIICPPPTVFSSYFIKTLMLLLVVTCTQVTPEKHSSLSNLILILGSRFVWQA